MKVRTNTTNQNDKREQKNPWLPDLVMGLAMTRLKTYRDLVQNPFLMPYNLFLIPQNSFFDSKLKLRGARLIL